jgi:hypothetical protein
MMKKIIEFFKNLKDISFKTWLKKYLIKIAISEYNQRGVDFNHEIPYGQGIIEFIKLSSKPYESLAPYQKQFVRNITQQLDVLGSFKYTYSKDEGEI